MSTVVPFEQFPEIAPGIRSSLDEAERPASYDRLAKGYDLLVGNAFYNRIVWGCPKSAYARNTAAFLSSAGEREMLDFGCGSLVFTAASYRGHERQLLLFDRSLGMLERGRARLPRGRFLQGDAFAAPFADSSFGAVCGWGMLHVFGTASPYLETMHRLAGPGAAIAIGTLTRTERLIGDHWLGVLEKQGEAAAPETPDAVTAAFNQFFRLAHAEQCGNMLFLHGTKA